MKLSKFKAEKYDLIDRIYFILWGLVSMCLFENRLVVMSGLKRYVLILFGAHCGTNIVIKPFVKIKDPRALSIGSWVWLGERVWIDNVSKVTIESNVCISQSVYICSGNHDFNSPDFKLIDSPVTISENSWVGCRCTILPGAVIPAGTFVKGGRVF